MHKHIFTGPGNRSQTFFGAVELFIIAVLVFCSGSIMAQAGGEQVPFRLVNPDRAQMLDRDLLEEEYQFGRVTVVLNLDSANGRVRGTKVAMDAPRTGPPEFGEAVQDIIRTWRYTPGASGTIYLTVNIPGTDRADDSPGIVMNTSRLSLGNNQILGRSAGARRNLVAQRGFDGNITLQTSEQNGGSARQPATYSTLRNVWDHLGMGFQIVFVVILLILILAIVITARKINTPWEPNGWKKAWAELLSRSKNGGRQEFTSPQSHQVERLWRRAIRNTYFGPELFQRLKMDAINRSQEKVERQDFDGGVEDLIEILEECHLKNKLGNDFIYYTDSLREAKGEVREYLNRLERGDTESLIQEVESCIAIYEVEEVLERRGLLEDFKEKKRSLRRSAEDLRSEVRYILKNLREMHDLFISTNGSSMEEGEKASAASSVYSPQLPAEKIARLRKTLGGLGESPEYRKMANLIREYGLESYIDLDSGANGESDQSLDEVKDQVRKQLGYALLEGEKEPETVTGLMERIKRCGDIDEIRSLLDEHGYHEILRDLQAEERESGRELKLKLQSFLDKIESSGSRTDAPGVRLRSGIEIPESLANKYSQFLWDYFGKPHIDEALRICEAYRGKYPLFEIFKTGLSNHLVNQNDWWTSQEVDRSVDRTASMLIEERRDPLDTLWAIGSLSPMVGLFGTVWGISQAFGKIRGVTETRMLMQKLAGDINVALATTIVGLVLGLVAFIVYYYFNYSLDKDASRIEKHFTEITNAL